MRSLFASFALALVTGLALVGCGDASSAEEESAAAAESVSSSDAGETPSANATGPRAEASASLANPVAAEGDSGSLARILTSLVRDPVRLAQLQANGHAAWRQHYESRVVYPRFVSHLGSLVQPATRAA